MKAIKLFQILIFIVGFFPIKSFSISCNQAGPDTINSNSTITGSCIINGDLVILNGGSLHVDLTGGQADTFIVRGNIVLRGNATLFINADSGSTGAEFIVSNSFNNQRTITTYDSSRVILQYVQFLTQEGNLSSASSYYMNYTAYDNSAFSVTGCWLNPQTAWLLCNMMNQSTMIAVETNKVPTELYLQDSAQVSVQGANTSIGLWLLFQSTTDTLNLPNQTSGPFSWQVGRGQGGVSASPWFLNVDNATPGIGVQIQPAAKLVVNGQGVPATGEIHANVLFANSTDTIENLQAGLQNTSVAKGRLTLNNVNLGPVAWQLYSVSNETLVINHSTVNEIGIEGPGNTVVVDSSILQLATLSALGTDGSTLTISHSSIWNQSITAANTSNITINNCNVTGSWFSADAQSHITVNNSCFFSNPSGCTENTMVDVNTGLPNCNPFIPSGFPHNLTPANVSFNGVNNNCATGIEETESLGVTIFPNPATETLNISLSENQKTQLQIFNVEGILIKEVSVAQSAKINTSDLASGLYFICLKDNPHLFQKFIKQ